MTTDELSLGSRLLSLCKAAEGSILLVSPFVKRTALSKVLSLIPDNVDITAIVRFLPIDIASGATDWEIVDDLLRRGATVMAQPTLHAKLYRTGNRALLGSANLTNRGLGWTESSNLELLVEMDASHPDIVELVKILDRTAYPLTPELVSSILSSLPDTDAILKDIRQGNTLTDNVWIPTCRRPSLLWEIYTKGSAASIVTSVVAAAGQKDIEILGVPAGLPKDVFRAVSPSAFRASAFYSELDKRLEKGTFSDIDAAEWLTANFSSSLTEPASESWETIKEWLREYCADRFHFSYAAETVMKAKAVT